MPRIRVTIAGGAAAVMVALLSVQFLLGMGVNLTAHVPRARFGLGSMMGVMGGGPLLMAHLWLGMLTAVAAVVTAVAAALTARAGVAVPGAAGLAAVLVAGYGGIRFLVTGGNAASFTMAAGFLIAYAAYFLQLVAVMRYRAGAEPAAAGTSPGAGLRRGAAQGSRMAADSGRDGR